MYKQISDKKSAIKGINGYDADCIEEKVRKIMNSKEPITDGAPLIYTERKEGVKPSYNIRTDRWEHAVEAMDKVTKAKIAAPSLVTLSSQASLLQLLLHQVLPCRCPLNP